MAKREYDSTVARIAGNLLAAKDWNTDQDEYWATKAVKLARAVVTETKRTEPEAA